MNKKKLQQLLQKLNSLESSLPLSEAKSYLDSLLEEETKNFQTKLKENPTIKFLDGFTGKLERFKKDFNLEPIIAEIEAVQKSMEEAKQLSDEEFKKIKEETDLKSTELTSLITNIKDDLQNTTGKELKGLLSKISSLEDGLSYQRDSSDKSGQSLKQVMGEFEKKFEDIFKTFKQREKNDNEHAFNLQSVLEDKDKAIKTTQDSIEKLRRDLFSRLSNLGGGNANRQINVNSSVMSNKYTDINFKNGSNVTITKADDEVNKRVNITIASTGGGAGNSFSINEVPAGTIDDSNVTFTLANTPVAGTVAVYVNRLRLNLTSDYSITDATITLINPVGTGGSIICDYQY